MFTVGLHNSVNRIKDAVDDSYRHQVFLQLRFFFQQYLVVFSDCCVVSGGSFAGKQMYSIKTSCAARWPPQYAPAP